MEKFKVGDKVVAMVSSDLCDWAFKKGDILIVEEIGKESFRSGDWWYSYDYFELKYKPAPCQGHAIESDKKEEKSENLLEKAKRLYPKGTKYKDIDFGNEVTVNGEFEYFKYSDGFVHISDGWGGSVYSNGKWAEIIKDDLPGIGGKAFSIPLDKSWFPSQEEKKDLEKEFEWETMEKPLRPHGDGSVDDRIKNGYVWEEKQIKKETTTKHDQGKPSRQFESGMKRDNDENKPYVHNLQGYTRLRFGFLTRMGARNYGDGNFLLGSPSEDALKSLDRHLARFLDGDRSEDHLAAMIFNIQLVMLNEKKEGIPADHYFKTK